MKKIISIFNQQRTFILYGIIGVSAVFVDLGVYLFVHNALHVSPVVSTTVSVLVAMFYAFTLNAVYNFKTKDFIKERFFSYMLVSMGGLLASVVIIEVLTSIDWDANWAKVVSLPPIVVLQYIVNKNLTFRRYSRVRAGASGAPEPVAAGEVKNIAIIGGGFTGLTAAYVLAGLGHRVTLYEAQSTLGGLVSGFELEGVPLERAYHFLYKTDRSIIELANEIGVGDKLHFYPSSVSLFYDGVLYPFMTPLDLLRFKPLSFINRIRAGVVAVYLSKVTNWAGFARVSAYEWMQKWGGKEVTRVIWEPVLRGKFFNYFDKIAMSYLWSRVYVRANSKDKGDITEKLGYFEGGFQTFTKALVERSKERGVQFHTVAKPTALVSRPDSIAVQFGNEATLFDACLSTIPSYVFRALIEHNKHTAGELSQQYLDQLSSVEYLGAVLMVFTSDMKITDYYWHNVNDLNHPFLVFLSLSALVGTEQLQGKHVYYIGAYVPHDHEYFTMDDAVLQECWVAGLQRIFPDFDLSHISSSEIFRLKNAQHIVEPNYQDKIVPYQSELPRAYLANYTQIFPDDRGTNYAVAEGVKVAHEIHRNLTSP